MDKQDPHQPATAAQVRALGKTMLVELPESGLTVEVGRVHIAELAAQGLIPDGLTPIVMRELGMDSAAKLQSPAALAEQALQAIDAVCCAVLVSPLMRRPENVVDAEATITPADLPYRDREHIFQVVCRQVEVPDLSRFRGQPDPDVGPLAAGDGLVDAPERDPRPAA